MHRFLAALVLLSLVGCASNGSLIASTAGVVAKSALPASDASLISATCAFAKPVLDDTAAPQTVKDVSVYARSFCSEMAAGDTSHADANSVSWLNTVLAGIKTAATIAKYVLPIALAVL